MLATARLQLRMCVSVPARAASSAPAAPPPVRPMLNYKWIADNVDSLRASTAARGLSADPGRVAELYRDRLRLRNELDSLRSQRKKVARTRDVDAGRQLKASVAALEAKYQLLEQDLLASALALPNLMHPAVIEGNEDAAVVVRHGGPPVSPEIEPWRRDHLHLANHLGMVDFPRAARVAGNSFYYLVASGALLEQALVHLAVQRLSSAGFTPVIPPDIVRTPIAEACGFQPRGHASQMYNIHGRELSLAGTSEIPLAAMHAGEVLSEQCLPRRYAGTSHCFRQEVAGGTGTESRGLYRVHQFTKVECFALCQPQLSPQLLEETVALQEAFLADLHLPYRVLDMPSSELGAPAYRKYDLEAWMPGRGGWGEVGSHSNCTDYQAQRLAIRYSPDERPDFGERKVANRMVHTLNGTMCAVPRIIIALLENHQLEDGRVWLPPVLRPLMQDREYLEPVD